MLPDTLAIITKREYLAPIFEQLQGEKLAVDTETSGLRWDRDRVGGLCLAARNTAAYICRDALGPAIRWLGDQVKEHRPLVGHNVKFDLHMLRGTFGLRVPYPVDDTMLQSFLLDQRGIGAVGKAGKKKGGHKLKNLAAHYIDPDAKEAQLAMKKAIKINGGKDEDGDVLFAPLRLLGRYGALDAWYTLQLDAMQVPRLRSWEQPRSDYPSLWSLYKTERWLLLALRDMEERGIRVQPEFFEAWRDDLSKQLDQTRRNLRKIAGKDINWASGPQLQKLLFRDLDLPITRWTKGGKSGNKKPSTDEVALLDLPHPIGAELLRFRDQEKQHGTYAQGLLDAVWDDGKIHASFRQIGAETGRLSCAEPNLQQVPRESGARRGFVPEKGLVLRFADYSQVEMRFAAHCANDPTLVHGFLNDPNFDTHAATAAKMWGLRGIAPTKQQRKFAKIMNFAMLYGAGEDKIVAQLISLLKDHEAKQALREFHYRLQPGEMPHRALAQQLRSRYFKEFPSIKGAARKATSQAEHRGYAMTLYGHHRFLEHGKEYTAFNTEVQGSAAGAAKRGLVRMYRELQLNEQSIALLLQIHDEAVYLSDGDPKTDKKVLELLRDDRFRVPIVADMSGSNTTWQDKKEIKLVA